MKCGEVHISLSEVHISLSAVEDIQMARNQQRKATVRWITVPKDKEHTFEFPARLLLYSVGFVISANIINFLISLQKRTFRCLG